MGVVLTILKILGIVLLCILGLVLLILALILFVPIRYQAEGKAESKEEYAGTVKVHWLLHAVSVCVDVKIPLLVSKRIRILGLIGRKWDSAIYPKPVDEDEEPEDDDVTAEDEKPDEKPEEKPAEKPDGKTEEKPVDKPEGGDTASVETADGDTPAKPDGSNDTPETSESAEAAEENTGQSDPGESAETEADSVEGESEENKPKKSLAEKIEEKWESFKETVSCVLELFGRRKDLLTKYATKPSTKAAIARVKKTLLWLLKTITPRKGHAEITFGLKDPELTGKIYAAAATLYPWYYKHIDVYPEFGGEALQGEGSVKGRIRLFGLVIRGIGLWRDKNIKKVRKEFKYVKDTMKGTPGELKKIIRKEAA
ncbi:MAG: hypothetical protein IJM57_06730 [Lachnospiraceae bacterium]|nr:hypothetical protein [Lachnospiraceae bacterium]